MAKKILIVDDEKEVSDLLTIALKSKGYNVSAMAQGNSLFDIAVNEKPDLIILDILLPGIDGYSIQLQFAQQEETKNIPIIILTALPAAKALFDEFKQVRHFVSKPFEINSLLSKVEEVLWASS
ncbi:MAG: response regulator [Elusimicrobia bacterium]|nr:response regulator [Candidatus Liberimonas magnetica]